MGALFAGLGVAAGALGAHTLSERLLPERLETFETAVRYQMYHALGLFAVAWVLSRWPQSNTLLTASGWLFVAGIVLFSGSLYGLALSAPRWLGAVAPIGGVVFVLGWLALLIAAIRS
jgi:uncharacterized membrane protein YgdD (TMEM256/DUF423 family)